MKTLALAAILALCSSLLHAAPIATTVSTTNNGYKGSLGLLNDGFFPSQGTDADGNATVWWNGNGADKVFQFTFDALYRLEDVSLSVDNDDPYALEYSADNVNWYALFAIAANLGEINAGTDTISTVPDDPEYIAQIEFSPVQAQYVRISADGGTKPYAIGELAFFGTPVAQPESLSPASVPEPGMLALLAAALGAGILTGRRRG